MSLDDRLLPTFIRIFKKLFWLVLLVGFAGYLYDFKIERVLAIFYGFAIVVLVNIQSARLVDKALGRISSGAGFVLARFILGELLKFFLLGAMLIIGIKGLELPVKEMLFSFIFFYLVSIFLISKPDKANVNRSNDI